MALKQLTVFVENKQGTVVSITDTLAKNNINLRALSIAETQDFGILRLIVDKPEFAEKALKEAGLTVSLSNVIAVGIPDKKGGIAAYKK